MAGFSEKVPYKLDVKNGFLEGKVETTLTNETTDLDTLEAVLVVAKMSTVAVNKRSAIPVTEQVDGNDTSKILMDARIFLQRPTKGTACITGKAPVDPTEVKAFKTSLMATDMEAENPTRVTINYLNA